MKEWSDNIVGWLIGIIYHRNSTMAASFPSMGTCIATDYDMTGSADDLE
jgi:hypothetical protein